MIMAGYLTQQGEVALHGEGVSDAISGGSLAGATSVGAIEGIYSGQDLPGGAGQPFSFVLLFQNPPSTFESVQVTAQSPQPGGWTTLTLDYNDAYQCWLPNGLCWDLGDKQFQAGITYQVTIS